MIKSLIRLNLKESSNKIHILVLVVIASIITYIKLGILNIPHKENFYMGDILLDAFGGLPGNYDLSSDIMSYILWLSTNIIVIYLINIGIVHSFRENSYLVLPRVKNKSQWFFSFNLTLLITVIKYYFFLFSASSFVTFIKIGSTAFKNTNIEISNYNGLVTEINQYQLVLYMFMLSVLTTVALLLFINNLYYIFLKSNEANIIGLLICLISVAITKSDHFNKFALLNHGMIKRHDMFKLGFQGFNIRFSICYLCIFILGNLVLGILVIKKRDLSNI